MKNILFAAIGLSGYALFSGFTNYNSFESNFGESCQSSGGTASQCACAGDAMIAEYNYLTFAGLGPFRPFMPDDQTMQVQAMAAAASCMSS